MTEPEIKRAQQDAERDAEWLALLLLLAFRRRDSVAVRRVLFDAPRGLFLVDGKAVTLRSVYRTLDRIRERMAGKLGRLTLDLEAGRITLSEWKRSFDRSITSSHILFGAFALGGIAVAVRNATLIDRVGEQLQYADAFSEEIRNGRAGSFAKIASRSKLYLQSPHILFTDLQLDLVKKTGFYSEAMNVLRPAEHCFRSKPDEPFPICTEITKRGWIPVDEMTPIGSRKCRRWCRCFLKFR
jgi:hypothetical protein